MNKQASRLDRLEDTLSPARSVLVWLEEAHEWPSLEAYVRAALDRKTDGQPLERILSRAETAARIRYRNEERITRDNLVRTAVRDAAFLYEMAIKLEASASAFVAHHEIRVMFMSHMLGDKTEEWLRERRSEDAEPDKHQRHLAGMWRAAVVDQLGQLAAERAARDLLVEYYLRGHSPLFADTAAVWERLESVAAQAVELLELAVDERLISAGMPDDEEVATAAARARAGELIDEARLAAYKLLGDTEAAMPIVEARLRRS